MQELFDRIMNKLGINPKIKAIGVEALRANASILDLSPPQQVEAKGMDEVRAAVDQQHARIGQLKKNLVQALEWERDVDEELAKLETADERRLLKRELKEETNKVEAFLEKCYTESDSVFRTAIVVTFVRFFFQKTFRSLEDYHRATRELRARGLMDYANKGESDAIVVGYEPLKFVNCAMERSEDVEIRRLATSFTQAMQGEWDRRSKDLREESTLTVDQLLNGSPGKCYLNVSKQEVPQKQGEGDGKKQYRFGGQLLVESSEGKIILLMGAGGAAFTRWRDYVLEKKMYLTLEELKASHVPGHRHQEYERIVKRIMRDTGLSRDDAREYIGKMQAFWYLIHRAPKASNQS